MNLSHYPVYTVEHQVARQSGSRRTEKSSKQGFPFCLRWRKRGKGEIPALGKRRKPCPWEGKKTLPLGKESFPALFPLHGERGGGERAANLYSGTASPL